jgi:hypothetical protein
MNIKKFILIAFLIFSCAQNLFAETKPVIDQASGISNTPHGNISSTDVQSAINELDSEKQPAGNYLTVETLFNAWQSFYDHHANWDTAYGWGNHASAGYETTSHASSTYVPYIGANATVNLGAQNVTTSGNIVTGDHGTASTAQTVNVCYGTSATPPTASTTTEGTLYVQYNN